MFGLGKSKEPENCLYKHSYMGFGVKVFDNRVEFRSARGMQSIPLSQIAGITKGIMGHWKVTIETTGGQKYEIPTNKKNELVEAVYKAMDSQK